MKLYDELIKKTLSCVDGYSTINSSDKLWKDAGNQNLVLKNEMAYELGGNKDQSFSSFMITSDSSLIANDEVIICGPDLCEIKEDQVYARITLVCIDDEDINNDDLYNILTGIDYRKYRVKPDGFMIRIYNSNNIESVRISKKAIENKINFEMVGNLFINEYKKDLRVKHVKVIFITDKNFDFKQIDYLCEKEKEITNGVDHILKKFKMDCATCNLKTICDEVEGMRELHFKQE